MKSEKSLIVRILLSKRLRMGVMLLLVASVASPVYEAVQADPKVALIPDLGHRLTDRDGNLYLHWPEYGNATATQPGHLPGHLVNAVIAREDQRFLSHPGVDWMGVARAGVANTLELAVAVKDLRKPRIVQGGSTVTMQLVELTYKRPETNPFQKFQAKVFEMVMAVRIERMAKELNDDPEAAKLLIMSRYLDRIPFGHNVTGVQKAADRTFGKPLSELTLGESAYLAGLIRAPSANSVYRSEDNARAARDAVVRNMLKLDMITKRQADEARFYARRKPKPQRRRGDGFTSDAIRREVRYLQSRGLLASDLLENGDVEIQTTLDVRLQDSARALLVDQLTKIERSPGFRNTGTKALNGCIVILDNVTGTVVACVGGRDFDLEEMNLATQGQRPWASAIKALNYAAYLEATGSLIEARLSNAPLSPSEAKGYSGKMDPRESLSNGNYPLWVGLKDSSNRMAVRAGILAGDYHWSRVLRDMDLIEGVAPRETSLFLGSGSVTPLQAAAAYACVARKGTYITPRFIRRILVDGLVVFEHQEASRLVLAPKTCEELTKGLREVLRDGTAADFGGKELARRLPVAGKTGTSEGGSDLWFCGFGSSVTVVVWIGFPDGSRTVLPAASGGRFAFPVWRAVVEELARRRYPFSTLPDRNDVRRAAVKPDLAGRR